MRIPPVGYILSALSIMVLTLLVVIDPIVIMRNQDVRQTLKEVCEKLIKKWCTKKEQIKKKQTKKEQTSKEQ